MNLQRLERDNLQNIQSYVHTSNKRRITATALTIDKRFVLSSCFSVALASVHVSGQCENAIKSFRSTCITYAKAYAFKANTSPSGTTVPKLRGVRCLGKAFATKRSIRSLNPLGSILNSSKCIFCHKTAGNRRIHQCGGGFEAPREGFWGKFRPNTQSPIFTPKVFRAQPDFLVGT